MKQSIEEIKKEADKIIKFSNWNIDCSKWPWKKIAQKSIELKGFYTYTDSTNSKKPLKIFVEA